MSKSAVKDAIKKIANREGKGESEIREEEMEEAIIMIGFLNKETRYKWDSLFESGRLPNPEEFIAVLSLKAMRR